VRSLVDRQLEVLFARDPEGRLVATRDPTAQPAPRLFLSRSPEGNVWALRRGLDPGLAAELEQICSAEPQITEPTAEAPPRCRKRVLELLSPLASEHRGPCFVLPSALPSDDRVREIEPGERFDWPNVFPWLGREYEAVSPVAIAFEGDAPVAICHSPRGQTADAAEAGVETLAPFRRRGLATAAVACWARAIQRTGRLALYSTSWRNPASRGVARRLSGRLYGENWHVT
jgi:RimJ/RimL family protein N-acetyltransferase